MFARSLAFPCEVFATSDGGEGFRRAVTSRFTLATAPDALLNTRRVRVGWIGTDAIIETAEVCGLAMIGGAKRNDPCRATSKGIGVLIAHCIAHKARTVTVGCGGSATTDGGIGAVEHLLDHLPLPVPLLAVTDVRTNFLDAARRFGPQKGASATDITVLTRRLAAIADYYDTRFSRDPREVSSAGSAGGIAGGLYALGAHIAPGLAYVSDRVGLTEALKRSDQLVTGEGRLDDTSFEGKVVGELIDRASALGISCTVVVGTATPSAEQKAARLGARVFSLEQHFGSRGIEDVYGCLEKSAKQLFG